jgi:hypothetical protein
LDLSASPPLGNCAEYDVIENVNDVNHINLLQTPQWDEFRSACQQNFDAFKTMLEMLETRSCSSKYILKEYYDLICTRGPKKPNVLKYEWNPKSEGGFELKNKDWPQPRPRREKTQNET